jgi:low temperature requirement protein LtrA
MPGGTMASFKRWFWRPPRPHGQTIADRRVSPLELLYDLVYVALIAQSAHHLAEDASLRTFGEFAVVAAMIWLAWINGSLYLELHGQPDGRTRSFVFLQIWILAVLAVFTEDAATTSSQPFALTYTAFLVVLTWLWYAVRRQDAPEWRDVTARYIVAMLVSVFGILATAFLPPEPRLLVWAAFVIGWFVYFVALAWNPRLGFGRGVAPTDSLVERFGLFTIIVLGEVVFGVVAGLSTAEHDAITIATGILALGLGFGFWWIYFDALGGRLPRREGRALIAWLLGHFPIALAIAASGAAMVGLIEHAHDARTPDPIAWLLSGAVALVLLAAAMIARSLEEYERLAAAYGPLGVAMGGGALVALGMGFLGPPPWLLVLALGVLLTALWLFAVSRFLAVGAWEAEWSTEGERPPDGERPAEA